MPAIADINVDWKIIAVAAVSVVGLYVFFKGEAKAAAGAAVEGAKAAGALVNPTAQGNLADRIADGVTESLTMREDDSLGKFIWRAFASDEDIAALDASMAKPRPVTK